MGYDSNDWKASLNGGIDADAVDANYEFLINKSAKRLFGTVSLTFYLHVNENCFLR